MHHGRSSEVLLKSVKKSLKVSIGFLVLSFSEMLTTFLEVANILNEKPIGRHPFKAEDCVYLCPNDLLLGRASRRIPSGPFDAMSSNVQSTQETQICSKYCWYV